MKLSDKLASITSEQIVTELDSMLSKPVNFSASWQGQRLISIDGYEGNIAIDDLARKYLAAAIFDENCSISIPERIKCYALWEQIKILYQLSSQKLNNNRFHKIATQIKEFVEMKSYLRNPEQNPMMIITERNGDSRKKFILSFKPEEFQQLWPNATPDGVITYGKSSIRWLATEDMLREESPNITLND